MNAINSALRHAAFVAALALLGTVAALPAHAQRMDMEQVAAALGVSCDYCHVSRGTRQPEPKKDIARAMMDMTDGLNRTIQTATGKALGEVTAVSCSTCHRGVPIPKPMDQILYETAMQEGGEAAIDRYMELRERFYGRGVYDFSEAMIASVIYKMANVNAEPALYLAALNIQQYPESSNAYMALSYIYTRLYDDASAIAALRRALELNPENGTARGQLQQLESYYPQLRNAEVEDPAGADQPVVEVE